MSYNRPPLAADRIPSDNTGQTFTSQTFADVTAPTMSFSITPRRKGRVILILNWSSDSTSGVSVILFRVIDEASTVVVRGRGACVGGGLNNGSLVASFEIPAGTAKTFKVQAAVQDVGDAARVYPFGAWTYCALGSGD